MRLLRETVPAPNPAQTPEFALFLVVIICTVLTSLAAFTRAEYPTHRMLQELIQLDASEPAAGDLAARLLPWCADSNYGCLLDGTSNISLTGKIAHFEPGYILAAAKLLRAAAGFLITLTHVSTSSRCRGGCGNGTCTKRPHGYSTSQAANKS